VTPTDAARMIIKHANNRQHAAKRMLCEDYGFRLSTGLLDAQARIADLEGALRQICQMYVDSVFVWGRDDQNMVESAFHKAAKLLTPEGGGK